MSASRHETLREVQQQVGVLDRRNHTLCLGARRSAAQSQFHFVEMGHRLKSAFVTSYGLAAQSTRPGDTGRAFLEIFGVRLLALACSHDFLGSGYSLAHCSPGTLTNAGSRIFGVRLCPGLLYSTS
jgi:hypothetical protein